MHMTQQNMNVALFFHSHKFVFAEVIVRSIFLVAALYWLAKYLYRLEFRRFSKWLPEQAWIFVVQVRCSLCQSHGRARFQLPGGWSIGPPKTAGGSGTEALLLPAIWALIHTPPPQEDEDPDHPEEEPSQPHEQEWRPTHRRQHSQARRQSHSHRRQHCYGTLKFAPHFRP